MRAAVVWAAAAAACGGVEQGIDGRLSAEGLYEDIATKRVASGAQPLSPRFTLWSDGAAKQRWLMLPAGSEIDSSDMDHWVLPVGTKLFKEFAVGGKRIETRMIERVTEAEYTFGAYIWLPDESDAVIAPEGARDVNGTGYDVPAEVDCVGCHRSEPGRSLGVSAIQLSAMLDELPLSRPANRAFEVPDPALGVLHANCGHCHNPDGDAPMQTLRFSVADADLPIEQTALYRTTVGVPLTDWADHGFTTRIVPGDPDGSAIDFRMAQRGTPDQMPPIGSELAYQEGRAIVRAWIEQL